MRHCSIVRTLGLTLALALASTQVAKAQYPGLWPTYGAYSYPGVGGFGYPGAAVGYGGWGYPGFGFGGMGGFGGFGGFGVGRFGFGGIGVGGFGFGGAVGYPPIAPYAFAPAYMGGYSSFAGVGPFGGGYGGLWSNPATLSLGITPLAIQSALMERGLSGTVVTPSVPAAAPAPAAPAQAPEPSATVPLTPGTYRITVERIDPAPPAAPNPR